MVDLIVRVQGIHYVGYIATIVTLYWKESEREELAEEFRNVCEQLNRFTDQPYVPIGFGILDYVTGKNARSVGTTQ